MSNVTSYQRKLEEIYPNLYRIAFSLRGANDADDLVQDAYSYLVKNNEKYMSLKVPKMLISSEGNLIYTSRHPLPASKLLSYSKFGNIQVCIYAYNIDNVPCYNEKRKKGFFEESEDLELLACIENNIEVKCIELENSPFSIDTEEDYQKLGDYYKKEFF